MKIQINANQINVQGLQVKDINLTFSVDATAEIAEQLSFAIEMLQQHPMFESVEGFEYTIIDDEIAEDISMIRENKGVQVFDESVIKAKINQGIRDLKSNTYTRRYNAEKSFATYSLLTSDKGMKDLAEYAFYRFAVDQYSDARDLEDLSYYKTLVTDVIKGDNLPDQFKWMQDNLSRDIDLFLRLRNEYILERIKEMKLECKKSKEVNDLALATFLKSKINVTPVLHEIVRSLRKSNIAFNEVNVKSYKKLILDLLNNEPSLKDSKYIFDGYVIEEEKKLHKTRVVPHSSHGLYTALIELKQMMKDDADELHDSGAFDNNLLRVIKSQLKSWDKEAEDLIRKGSAIEFNQLVEDYIEDIQDWKSMM